VAVEKDQDVIHFRPLQQARKLDQPVSLDHFYVSPELQIRGSFCSQILIQLNRKNTLENFGTPLGGDAAEGASFDQHARARLARDAADHAKLAVGAGIGKSEAEQAKQITQMMADRGELTTLLFRQHL
jgi:hypothetical protein